MTSSDDVCGEFLQPTYVVTHVFTGRYDVTSTSERRLQGGEGFLEIRLATENRAGVLAIDTGRAAFHGHPQREEMTAPRRIPNPRGEARKRP